MFSHWKKTLKKRDSHFIGASLLLHAMTYAYFTTSEPPPPNIQPKKVEIEIVEPPEAQPQPKLVKPTKAPKNIDQIVEQKDRVNDEKAPDSQYLSAFDQKVIKETRAERSGKFNNKSSGGKKEEGDRKGKKESEIKDKVVKTEKGDLPNLADLSPKLALDPGPKGLQPDTGDPAQTDDYLKEVNTGLQTLLSTREFVYYSYYNRIKESLRQHWEPNVREKVKITYRKGRSIASAKDRVTQLLVVLDGKGELIRVELVGKSGIESLDEAAVEAFRNAAPFPNPPAGMVEKDGTIKIRWDFVLEA